jgi:flagella basal body P-ring formation protein FlgA
MPKKIDLEIREAFGKPFLKVFIHDLENIEKVKQVISQCGSVGKVNIYKTGENLTVYPNQVYSIEELQDEVRLVLSTLYEGSPIDPVFIEEPISKISEKAYAQIIDNIIRFGKELEKKL